MHEGLALSCASLCAGKMFKSLDLSLIVEFMLMFYKDKPIDWLLDHIMWVKVCNPEKDAVSGSNRNHQKQRRSILNEGFTMISTVYNTISARKTNITHTFNHSVSCQTSHMCISMITATL